MRGTSVIQSVARALDLLEAAQAYPSGMSLAEASQATGLHVTTAHNLITTLVSRGYLAKTARPVRYRIGPRLAAFGGAAPREEREAEFGQTLRSLAAEQAAGSFILASYDQGQFVTVLRVYGARPACVERPRGDVLHPYSSATALLFQAFWPAEQVVAHRAQHPFWRFGEPAYGTLPHYERRLAQVRRQGWSQIDAADFGYRLAAAPVRDTNNGICAALGAAVPLAALALPAWNVCVKSLVAAAQTLSTRARPDLPVSGGVPRGRPPLPATRKLDPASGARRGRRLAKTKAKLMQER